MLRQPLSSFGFVLLLFLLPTLCFAQANKTDPGVDEFLTDLEIRNPNLLKEAERRLTQSQREIEMLKRGFIVYGRIELTDGKTPRAVVSQMILMEDGSFVDAVGQTDMPIGFRLQGYEPLEVTPKGPGPFENLGVIKMKQLPPDQKASATGQLQVETRPGAPRLDQIQVTMSLLADPVNTPHGGTEGVSRFHRGIDIKVAEDGTFNATGMTPGKYNLVVTAPNCVQKVQIVDFNPGETQKLDPMTVEVARKMNVEFAVGTSENFEDAKFEKVVLKANDRWRASEDSPKYACDLMIGQENGQLLLRWVYGPCHIKDLGAHELNDDIEVNIDHLRRRQEQNVPVEDGHVYLVHQASLNHWILLRTTLDKD